MTIGILDSGISTYHDQMSEVEAIQYNPLDETFLLKDTGLGHASGILSLLLVKKDSSIESGYVKNGNERFSSKPSTEKYFKPTCNCRRINRKNKKITKI